MALQLDLLCGGRLHAKTAGLSKRWKIKMACFKALVWKMQQFCPVLWPLLQWMVTFDRLLTVKGNLTQLCQHLKGQQSLSDIPFFSKRAGVTACGTTQGLLEVCSKIALQNSAQLQGFINTSLSNAHHFQDQVYFHPRQICILSCFRVENSLHQKYTEVAGRAHRVIEILVAKFSILTSLLKQKYRQCWVTSDVAFYIQALKTFEAGAVTMSFVLVTVLYYPPKEAALYARGKKTHSNRSFLCYWDFFLCHVCEVLHVRYTQLTDMTWCCLLTG